LLKYLRTCQFIISDNLVGVTLSVQEKLLEELNQWHTDASRFSKSAYEAVEKTGSHLQDAVRFSERLLQYGSTDILPLRQVILGRIRTLSSDLPYLMGSIKYRNGIEFETDVSKFCAIVQAGFGHFASADDGSGMNCCKKSDESLCLGAEMYSKKDIGVGGGGVSLPTPSKVCDSAAVLLSTPTT